MSRADNALIIDPPVRPERVQPASVELTLAEDILVEVPFHQKNEFGVWVVERVEWHEAKLPRAIKSSDFWLASTVEEVHIPTDLCAMVNGKSSIGRRGLSIHQTAGFGDPNFKGTVTLELANASQGPIMLEAGMPICQLVFFQMTSPALRPYGSDGLGSHYMGQVGPTPARV